MIQEINAEKASQKAKDMYNKGSLALERGNIEYALDMLYACVEMEPGLVPARKMLRIAEIKRCKQKKASFFSTVRSSAGAIPGVLKAQALVKANKMEEAVNAAEGLLKTDPLNLRNIKIFVDAAVAIGLVNSAIQTLELIREFYQSDIYVLNTLAILYQKIGRTKSAKECIEKLCEVCPNDPDVMKLLKDITAIDSMTVWDEAKDYRDVMKDKKEAELLEKESKAEKNEKDLDFLIEDMLKKIEVEPDNMKLYRGVARMYVQKLEFETALNWLQKALDKSPGDPELDVAFSSTKVGQFDHHIAEYEKAGKQNEAIELKNQRIQYIFDDLADRVRRYPNDLKLRYEWGMMLYEHEYVNEAIQQLQLAQRSPKHRVKALYYLAMCFKQKKQYDIALEQLSKAKEELPIMDATKKDVVYEQGAISDLMGQHEQAVEFFKEIYQVDIGYKDVTQRVEKGYK